MKDIHQFIFFIIQAILSDFYKKKIKVIVNDKLEVAKNKEFEKVSSFRER